MLIRFVVRRLIQMAGVLLVLSLLLFFWLRALPGGPVSAILGERATPSRRAALEAALGLDQPIYVQYLKFLERAIQVTSGSRPRCSPATTRSRSSGCGCRPHRAGLLRDAARDRCSASRSATSPPAAGARPSTTRSIVSP